MLTLVCYIDFIVVVLKALHFIQCLYLSLPRWSVMGITVVPPNLSMSPESVDISPFVVKGTLQIKEP